MFGGFLLGPGRLDRLGQPNETIVVASIKIGISQRRQIPRNRRIDLLDPLRQ